MSGLSDTSVGANRARKRVKFLAKLGISLGVLAALFVVAGPRHVLAALAATNFYWLAPLYALALVVRFVEAAQMQLLLSKAGAPVRILRVVLANLLASFYALLVPGDIVASGAKWSNLSAATGKRSIVLNAIVYNRLALLLPSMFVGACALAIENPLGDPWLAWILVLGVLCGLGLAFLLWHPRTEHTLGGVLKPVAALSPRSVRSRIDMLLGAMRPFRSFSAYDHASILSIGVASAVLATGLTVISFQAVGIDVSLVTMVWIHAVIVAVRQLPITISGLGVREGLLVMLLAPYAVSPEAAIALGLLKFSTNMALGLAGGIYQLALTMGWATWKPPADGLDGRPSASQDSTGRGNVSGWGDRS